MVESTITIEQERREIGLCLIEKKSFYELFGPLYEGFQVMFSRTRHNGLVGRPSSQMFNIRSPMLATDSIRSTTAGRILDNGEIGTIQNVPSFAIMNA
jgi:hypothetical protein